METWRNIEGFQGYSVSNDGRVLTDDYNHTHQSKELKIFKNAGGYMACNLMRNGVRKRKTIHQLVAKAFLPNPNRLTQINHKNGVKSDNRIENLEWCTGSHNIRHAFDNGLLVAKKGERHYAVKISDAQVIEIRELRKSGMKLSDIADRFGVCFQYISGVCTNRYRT